MDNPQELKKDHLIQKEDGLFIVQDVSKCGQFAAISRGHQVELIETMRVYMDYILDAKSGSWNLK